MSFGVHFQYQKPTDVLPEGEYDVTLGEAFETTVGGYAVLRFPFCADGVSPETKPNYFDLFDCIDPNNKDKRDMFNKRASRIIDCFQLTGFFNTEGYRSWKGKRGRILVTKDENGFTNVSKFLPKSAEASSDNNNPIF